MLVVNQVSLGRPACLSSPSRSRGGQTQTGRRSRRRPGQRLLATVHAVGQPPFRSPPGQQEPPAEPGQPGHPWDRYMGRHVQLSPRSSSARHRSQSRPAQARPAVGRPGLEPVSLPDTVGTPRYYPDGHPPGWKIWVGDLRQEAHVDEVNDRIWATLERHPHAGILMGTSSWSASRRGGRAAGHPTRSSPSVSWATPRSHNSHYN